MVARGAQAKVEGGIGQLRRERMTELPGDESLKSLGKAATSISDRREVSFTRCEQRQFHQHAAEPPLSGRWMVVVRLELAGSWY